MPGGRVANDREDAPPPRPRRRRTDIDPKAQTPPVVNERRRPVRPRLDRGAADAPLTARVDPLEPPADGAATRVFHLPGGISGATPGAEGAARAASAAAGGLATTLAATAPAATSTATTSSADEERAPWLPSLDDRSLDPGVCPFLRAAQAGDLVAPIERPDPANRCAALRDTVPQSLRQQELVCLTSGHVNCPRYLRGSAVVVDVAEGAVRARSTISPALLASVLVLVLAFGASVAFVVGRGGLELAAGLPSASPGPSGAALASSSPAAAAASPTPVPTPTPAQTAVATASATSVASPSPTPTATPTPSPTPGATPRPTSDRYALLTACPDTARCWIYRVRRGDNLFSIANYFGVSLDSIYARNPWLRTSGLRQGQQLRLPPPTR
jgi:LysM repeat protein